MKKNATKITIGILIVLSIAGVAYWAMFNKNSSDKSQLSAAKKAEQQIAAFSNEEESEEEELEMESKKERQEYFFHLLRNPTTNSIPSNIRARELNHARNMPSRLEINRRSKSKNPSVQVAEGFNWKLAGPPAVGGRTRAMGIDQRDPDIIIAGGVSGGIWKSTDGGDTWSLKTPDFDNFSVTYLDQDPTHPDIWYYVAGEFLSNTASAPAGSASYYGTGLFKSTDNGETWNRIPGASDTDAIFNSKFDYISRVVVSPQTGTVFISSNGVGISRSPDGTDFSDIELGGLGFHAYATVNTASDGKVAAVLSSLSASSSPVDNNPGVFVSSNDGQDWTDVTPSDFPANYGRSVIAFAPSAPNILYVFTQKINDPSNQGLSLFKIDLSAGLSNPSFTDLSSNLPDYGDPVGGLSTQGGYDMIIKVKPDDPDFVILGGTNLYRSRDGFSTPASDDKDENWIGGYAKSNDIGQYPNHHADQHTIAFDPGNPDKMWSGNDGGVYLTNDITANAVSWNDKNKGYIVTQFYDASLPPLHTDSRLVGGTQDNGSPLFSFNNQQNIGTASADISSGDGGYSFFTDNYIYVSNAKSDFNSRVIRFNSDLSGSFAIVQPSQAQTSLFINPYTVDPNDDGIMYYPGGRNLYRNTKVDEITSQNGSGTSQNWQELSAATLEIPYVISALSVSQVPTNILYYAGSDTTFDLSSARPPVLKRLDNANTSNTKPKDISIPNVPAGAFIHSIAVNPVNGNDVLVVMTNYGIVGLYHSTDGGGHWQAVEGNLTGSNDPQSNNPGPSLRSATIVPSKSGAIYILGTSTGVYATQDLDGDNTQWGRESAFDNNSSPDIGYSVVEDITSRVSDGDIAVGTHGRGMFVGRFQGEVSEANIPIISIDPIKGRAGSEVTITATNFQFSSMPSNNEVLFGNVQAEVTEASATQLTVIVPRGTLAPTATDRTVLIHVINNNGANPQAKVFTIQPPGRNSLRQNFPNPFGLADNTKIPINLVNPSNVTIQIYDISGRLVDQPLKEQPYQAGTYNVPIDFSGKASGVYIYRIIAEPTNQASTFVDSKKFTFIK